MKTLKNLGLTVCACVLMAQFGFSQDTTNWRQSTQEVNRPQTFKWNDFNNPPLSDMHLSAGQRHRIDSLYSYFSSERQKLWADEDMDSTARTARMNELMRDEETQMNDVLDMSQLAQLRTWRQKNPQPMMKAGIEKISSQPINNQTPRPPVQRQQ